MRDFRQIAPLIASLLPLVGCTSSIGEFDDQVCPLVNDSLVGVTPVEGIDYLALRKQFTLESAPELAAEWGQRCSHATDPMACSTALDAIPFDLALVTQRDTDFVAFYDMVFTRVDETGKAETFEQLLGLLGDIDTPDEAALVAAAKGFNVACNEPNMRREGTSFVLLGTKGNTCGGDVSHFEITVTAEGGVSIGESEIVEHGDPNCAIGRRPAGLDRRGRKGRGGRRGTGLSRGDAGRDAVGAFFARAAHLEAASIIAFEHLRVELTAHGAPASIVRGAARSRRDEIRHARVTAALARRFGARPEAPVIGPRAIRPLEEVALDNATEGCVRETFGAVIAAVQACRAADPAVRSALGTIAVDEARHAALSWAIDAWALGRLGASSRRRLREARAEAADTLRRELGHSWHPAVRVVAGMPSASESLALAAAADAALWSRS